MEGGDGTSYMSAYTWLKRCIEHLATDSASNPLARVFVL